LVFSFISDEDDYKNGSYKDPKSGDSEGDSVAVS
jgi:hypothetical protein